MSNYTKKITITAFLLAIAVASMFFKNMNVFIAGSIVNTCLILITLFAGIKYGIISSVLTPIFSFIITGSPIIAAIPLIMPMIMIGNAILCSVISIFYKKKNMDNNIKIIFPMIIGSIIKAIFMGVVIALIIVPMLLPEKMMKKLPEIQFTFSIIQLITSLIASFFSTILYKILIKFNK